jgi:small-conductance mechanosensitive channel/CRP-like cAMP-binding protein
MDFDLKLAEAVGLALGVWLVVWLGFGFFCKRFEKRPLVSLQCFAVALGLWVGAKVFYSGQSWLGHLGAVLIFAGVVFAWGLFDRIVTVGLLERRGGLHVPNILRQFGGSMLLLGVLAAIMGWGYEMRLTGFFATSGIAAVILGFAMQDLLSNVIAGFSIHMTRAYKVGDWLLLGSDGKRAEVREISWRSTRLLDNDRISHELPNNELVKSQIVNLNYPTPEHGVRLTIGLDYDTPPALAKEVLLKVAKEAQGVIENPEPVVFTKDFADSSVIYELRFWMLHARLYNVTCDDIRTGLWYELGRRNMRIPFPIRSIDIRTSNVPQHLADARKNAASILQNSGILSCLSKEETEDLVAKGRVQIFGPKEALVTGGEVGESMFLILDGKVEVVGRNENGPRVNLASLGAGDSFGEMSLVTGEPRNATVRAIGDVMVLEITKAHIAPLMLTRAELAERIGKLLEERKENRDESLSRAAQKTTGSAIHAGPEHHSIVQKIRHFFGHG